jgi:hypothetical protein
LYWTGARARRNRKSAPPRRVRVLSVAHRAARHVVVVVVVVDVRGFFASRARHHDEMAPPRRGRCARDGATAGGGDGVRSSDDAVDGRIDALAAKCDALAAENSALAAKCDALAVEVRALKEVGASPSAGRKRARVEDPPSLEEELATTTTRLLELQNAVRGLEEREAAREPLLERLAADARDVLNAHVLSSQGFRV